MTFDAKKAKLLVPGAHLIIEECPGLRFEVRTASRTWIYRYRSPVDQKIRQIKIGQWPAKSLSIAIEEWSALRDLRLPGKDPAYK